MYRLVGRLLVVALALDPARGLRIRPVGIRGASLGRA